MATTFATLGELLLRRYVTDYISTCQQLSSPIYSRIPENGNFVPSGEGAFFAVHLDGNESGGGWRSKDDNFLPAAGNERVKQAKVEPRKYYHTVTFSGLAAAVSKVGGQDAFASGISFALSNAIKRAGANFETNFLRSDGSGMLTQVRGNQTATTVNVNDARPFRAGQVVVFLNNSTGARTAGPVQVTGRTIDSSGGSIVVSSSVTVSDTDRIHISGEQNEVSLDTGITAIGLPGIVNNSGKIYGLDRSTYPILQSKVIDAGSTTALDESMLRRLRKQLMVETAVDTLNGFVMISNHDQFDRYTEISLPFRRFNDMRLELGAQQELTTFEGRPWLISWAAFPNQVFFLNLGAIERGVVRPLSIDENVNMAWIPGQDAFTVLFKYYGENVGRMINQTAKIINLTVPSY